MAVDINKLSRGEQVISISGIVLVIFSFIKWYGLDLGGDLDIPGVDTSFSANGWDRTLGMFAAIIAIVMVAQILASKFGNMDMPDLGSVTWGQVHLGLGALAALFVIICFFDDGGAEKKFGLFISIVAALGLAAGGYLKFQEEKGGAPASGAPGPGPTA
jgi:hypothetical protein